MVRIDIDFNLIGERIKNARIKKGWTKAKMAKEINESNSYINKIENEGEINLKKLAKISQILEVEIAELIVGTIPNNYNYLENDLHQILLKCTRTQRKFIYNVAKIVSESQL